MTDKAFFGETCEDSDRLVLDYRMLHCLRDLVAESQESSLITKANRHIQLLESSVTEIENASVMSKKILQRITDNREITTHQAQVFVLYGCDGNETLTRLKGVILLNAFEHQLLFGPNERVRRAMTSWRLMAQKLSSREVSSIVKIIPSLDIELAKLVEKLNTILDCDEQSYSHTRLMPIRRLLEDVSERVLIKKRINNGPNSGTKSSPDSDVEQPPGAKRWPRGNPIDFRFTYISMAGDDEIPSHIEFSDPPLSDGKHQDQHEYGSDNSSARTYLAIDSTASSPEWVKQSAGLSAMLARATMNQMERREKRLSTSWSGLTRFEVSTLVYHLINDEERETASVRSALTNMLLTGRRFNQFLESFSKEGGEQNEWISKKEGRWYWNFNPELPKHELKPEFQKLVDAQNNAVVLGLDKIEFSDQQGVAVNDLLRDQIEAWLKKINSQFGTRLTLNRVCDYLQYFLHQQGVDDVEIALIVGDTRLQQPGVYYQQYDVKRLQEIHADYVNVLFGVSVPRDVEGHGGSKLALKDNVVTALWAHQKQLVEKTRRSRNMVEFHNAYTLLIVTMLNLATGHRPVKDPYDDLRSFDLVGKKIFISDKEIRSGDAFRTLVLPELVVSQVDAYTAHLRSIEESCFWSDRNLSQSIQASLNGTNSMFFLLQDDGEIKRTPMRPGSVHEHVAAYFDLPLNWHRHYLRTTLSRWNVPGEVIDTFMGHARPGQEGLSKFSGISIKGLKSVADRLDQHFTELEMSVVQGWDVHG